MIRQHNVKVRGLYLLNTKSFANSLTSGRPLFSEIMHKVEHHSRSYICLCFWHCTCSTPKALQILWPLGFSVSRKSFIKSNIFPEATCFNVFEIVATCLRFLLVARQEEYVESHWENNYFTTKKDIPISSPEGFKTVFQLIRTTSFPYKFESQT